ncbi:MAG: Hpt domain-containing protein [Campylobacterales bacterium]
MDVNLIAQRTGLEPDEVETIAQVFVLSAGEALKQLKGAVTSGDDAAAIFALHKIAGSSAALLGFGELNEIARNAEEALKRGEKPDLSAVCAAIETPLVTAGVL